MKNEQNKKDDFDFLENQKAQLVETLILKNKLMMMKSSFLQGTSTQPHMAKAALRQRGEMSGKVSGQRLLMP
ncbi:hypothetical protein [Pedobacter glucosidilyticus]|uniref:hypothetical protein n=1 Tax=Pedobacter glucosidilyticus TaxID=1122941 RepID=UPI0003F99427|nr:hypothetical protein [Pedobacter glucosidilyticus]